VITAITDEALEDGTHKGAKMEFLSRFVILGYSHSISTVMAILNSYSEHGLSLENTKVKLQKSKQVNIKLPNDIANKLDSIAMKIGERFHVYGFRAEINFRSLLKCPAQLAFSCLFVAFARANATLYFYSRSIIDPTRLDLG